MTYSREFSHALGTEQGEHFPGLKILLLVEASLGGVGNHTTSLAEGLWLRGHKVHLVYSPLRADRLFEQRIRRLREQCSGMKLLPVPIERMPGRSDLAASRTISRYCHSHGPFDVVHAHSTKAGFLARLRLRKRCTALLYTPHAPLTMKPELSWVARSAVRALEVLLATRTDALIAVCKDESDHLIRLGIPARRVSVIESGIACGSPVTPAFRTKMRSGLNIQETDLCIGYVGRFDTQKRPDVLLKAYHRLVSGSGGALKRTRLVMAGFGPQLEQLKREARILGVSDHIIWPGEVDGRALLGAFDVFALPSDYEALPYCLLEALFAGLPIVTTDVSGANSIVCDGKNGFIVPRRQPEAFAAALDRILSDSELRAQMGVQSSERSEYFTLDRMVDETEKLYRSSAQEMRPPLLAMA